MSLAFKCQVCDGDPLWRITRVGDVVVSWACSSDLSAVCESLQRDFEVTELVVEHQPKLHEVVEINRALEDIASEVTR